MTTNDSTLAMHSPRPHSGLSGRTLELMDLYLDGLARWMGVTCSIVVLYGLVVVCGIEGGWIK